MIWTAMSKVHGLVSTVIWSVAAHSSVGVCVVAGNPGPPSASRPTPDGFGVSRCARSFSLR